MTRASLLFLCALSGGLAGAGGCSLPPGADGLEATASTSDPKIIGENDLVRVSASGDNIPARYVPLLDAFGRATNKCTVTHVGHGVVISAGHCFVRLDRHARDAACDLAVLWGLRGTDGRGSSVSECVVLHEARYDADADWAIFSVTPVPPVAITPSFAKRAPLGTTLTVFGHPLLRPLEWSQRCTLNSGNLGGWGASEFAHDCDTEPGSSGSSILDDATLEAVGIHGGGNQQWNYGTYLSDTPLQAILAAATPAAR